MHIDWYNKLALLPGGIVTDGGELAWQPEMIQPVLQLVNDNNWIILGGDVLTKSQRHTYDNWYFEVNTQCSLKYNVKASIDQCAQYVSEYIKAHGNDFLFVFVISNDYADGN